MLYTVEQLRQIEQATLAHSDPGALMRAAGKAAANAALRLLTKANQSILVFAGPGNNGGDALEAAVHLASTDHHVFVLYHPPQSSTSTISIQCQQALDQAMACPEITWLESDASLENSYSLVIDGLFGIGLKPHPMPTYFQRQIEQINTLHRYRFPTFPVLALDVPSGLDADTGNLIAPFAIEASHTITFIGDKPGLHTGCGRDYAGEIEVADLAITPHFFTLSDMQLNNVKLFSDVFQPRHHRNHKGSFGTVMIIGGAIGMQGAVMLAGRAALYAGAGRTLIGFVESPPAFDMLQPELMCRLAEKMPLQDATAVVIGPGLGKSDTSNNMTQRALKDAPILVMDADALNLMAQQSALLTLCQERKGLSTLLTPHPLEAARLLNCSVEDIQADRIAAAKNLAKKYNSLIILKGSGSVLAHPNGVIVINPTGNPALATGGTGDVLAGVCGALAAQHSDLWQAALAATWLHGTAADNLVANGVGPVGLYAGELFVEIRRLLNTQATTII